MILFKVLFRRYAILGYLSIFFEFVFLFNELYLIALVFNLIILSLLIYKLFDQNDELRNDILFFSNFNISVILYRYLFLMIFTSIITLPYLAIKGLDSIFIFLDYDILSLLFLILANRFARKKIFFILFLILLAIDIYYNLAYTCFTQDNLFYLVGLFISHSILLYLLLKDYKEMIWKHLII